MKFQVQITLDADSNDDAIKVLQSIAFPAGTVVQGMIQIPPPIAFTNLPQTIDKDGAHVESIEEYELPPPAPIDPGAEPPEPLPREA